MNAPVRIQATSISLDQLKPGHEFPGANINSRTSDRAAERYYGANSGDNSGWRWL